MTTLEKIYGSVIQIITTAMHAGLLDQDWMVSTIAGKQLNESAEQLFRSKQITRNHLSAITDAISSQPLPLLKQMIALDAERLTALEEKLLLGGATPSLIEAAKSLRAQAVTYEIENSSARLWDDYGTLLEDTRSRLLLRVAGFDR